MSRRFAIVAGPVAGPLRKGIWSFGTRERKWYTLPFDFLPRKCNNPVAGDGGLLCCRHRGPSNRTKEAQKWSWRFTILQGRRGVLAAVSSKSGGGNNLFYYKKYVEGEVCWNKSVRQDHGLLHEHTFQLLGRHQLGRPHQHRGRLHLLRDGGLLSFGGASRADVFAAYRPGDVRSLGVAPSQPQVEKALLCPRT